MELEPPDFFFTKMLRILIGENAVSLTNSAGKLDIYMQKNKTRLLSPSCTQINSKWIKDLNVSLKTAKGGKSKGYKHSGYKHEWGVSAPLLLRK